MDPPSVNLLASCNNPDGSRPSKRCGPHQHSPFFKSVQWSADGTTLFTSSSSNRICTFVLPETLLEPRDAPLTLTSYSTLTLPEPTSAIASCPYFALENPSTQVFLTASTDHPIHLHHAFPFSPSFNNSMDIDNDDNPTPNQSDFPKPLASFHLIKKETEAYLPIASLIWPAPGTHFVAGTINRIDIFDVSRPDISLSTQPFHTIPTIPSTRFLTKGGGVGMRGTVSALDAHPGVSEGWGFIAAGTWTRNLGLYDLSQAGQCVATWSVAPASGEQGIGGNGIVQVMWSPCGRYLVVNERRSTGLLVYDIRGTHQLLACLKGRDAQTNQRLSCDVFPGTGKVGGFEVWAGTKNGGVVVWEGIGNQEGSIEPSWDWEAHQAAVGSTALHMSGSVVATCSGSWEFVDEDESSESESIDSSDSSSSSSDSEDAEQNSGKRVLTSRTRIVVPETSLKVWSIGSNTPPETDEGQTS